MGEGSMTFCNKHPYKNNPTNPGGICAFCLQEKLGKLVSSSLPLAVFPSSSTTPASQSFRSESGYSGGGAAASVSANRTVGSSLSSQKKARIRFLSYHRRKKEDHTAATGSSNGSVIFKRSNSTTTPSRKFLDGCENRGGDYNHLQKRWFWSSFWYHQKRGSEDRSSSSVNGSSRATPSASFSQRSRHRDGVVSSVGRGIEGDIAEEEDEEDDYNSSGSHVTTSTTTSFGRKVSRSRSVGCGSRSFSGDFFERISTGFGDCTLRRVESQREGHNNKSKVADSCMKERVRCGGIFGGFIVNPSSSSSQCLPPSAVNPRQMVHGKGRSWSWAFASPIRGFSKPSSGSGKSDKNSIISTPNLSAMPSLLSVGNK